VLAVLLYSVSVVRIWAAWQLAKDPGIPALKRAIALDGNNPAYHERLGVAYLSQSFDVAAAANELETATRLNPHAAALWLELTTIRQVMGEDMKAVDALERAIAAEPHSSTVAWYAASFWTMRDAPQKAVPFCQTILQNREANLDSALMLCWRASGGDAAAMTRLLPSDRETYLRLIKQLVRNREMRPAGEMWSSLLAVNKPVPLPEACRMCSN
jgi:tetratricopeptide (TPR) repeat protein